MNHRAILLAVVVTLLGLARPLAAQTTPPASAPSNPAGVIEGRVLNESAGEYLNNARVTIEGAQRETFTDSLGQYRFTGVVPGRAMVRVHFTGFPVQSQAVTVEAGRTVELNFEFRATEGAVVKLDQFVVSSQRETNPEAIAINEQRYSTNIKNVVETGEYGVNPTGNVGDFLKFIPGVTIENSGGDPRYISLEGAPPDYVPVTVGGFGLANSASGGTNRRAEFEQLSLNNMARVEIIKSPTPESPGSALAGSVNFVPRTAFELSRPKFQYTASLMARDNLPKTFAKGPGGDNRGDRKINPGGTFSYTRPVSNRFGFSIAGAYSTQVFNQQAATLGWFGTLQAGAAGSGATPANPYLANYVITDYLVNTNRRSWSATVDFRPGRNDVVSVGIQWSYIDWLLNQNSLTSAAANSGIPRGFGPTYMRGPLNVGIFTNITNTIEKWGTTYLPNVTWRHNGPLWKADGGLGYGYSNNHYRNQPDAMSTNLRRAGDITIDYENIWHLRPGTITVTGPGGVDVDPYVLSSYSLQNVNSTWREAMEGRRTAYGNLGRDFTVRGVPVALKVGARVEEQRRDIENVSSVWTYRGPDGRASTTPVNNDDAVPALLEPGTSQRYLPWGFPRLQVLDPLAAGDFFRAHPEWFVAPTAAALWTAEATNSKFIKETISAAYVRGDTQLLERRLKLTTGVRAEQTNAYAEALLMDNTANFQRDASGKLVKDAAGNNVRIYPAGSLEENQLIRKKRAARVSKEYLRMFPSLNASYLLRENLVLRGAYYWSLGRPDFNQYAGGVTLPNLEAAPSDTNRITINNPNIKPWEGRSAKVTLDYYFEPIGVFTIDAFRRDLRNFFVGSVGPATPALLAASNLSDLYLPFDVATNRNSAYPVRVSGISFNYKQALTFLPTWARGLTLTANELSQRVEGVDTPNITTSLFVPWTVNAGLRLDRERFSLMVNGNYRARTRQLQIAATGAWVYYARRINIDVEGTYWLNRNKSLGVFLNGLNLRDESDNNNEVIGNGTPRGARSRNWWQYGVLWTLGLRGSF